MTSTTDRLEGFALIRYGMEHENESVRRLASLAESGMSARLHLDGLSGMTARVAAVRAQHDMVEGRGGMLICPECSRPYEPVMWPCQTAQLLDGIPAP